MDPISIAMGLAQFAPSLIKWITGSDKAEDVANKAIDLAQQVTGTINSAAAIAGLQANPDLVLKYRQAVLDQELEFQKLAIQNASDINKTMQVEAAAEHWPTYGWRPFIGFSFGAYLNAQWLLPLFKIDTPHVDPELMLVVGSILGIASWYRGKMQADPAINTVNRG